VVIFLARSSRARPELIGLAAGTTTLLSLWRTLHEIHGVPFPVGVFDNSPFYAYIETAPGGVQRYRGILSEPAGLAGSSLVTIAYMLSRTVHVRGLRRVGTLAVAAVAGYLGTISTSATFVVAAGAIALIAALSFAVGFLLRRTSVSAVVSVLACVLAVVAIWVLPVIGDFAEARVSEKVSSASFSERSRADGRCYDILVDTFGSGVGLGAGRASSFLPGLLATTGIVGTLLLAAAVAGLIRRGAALPEYRPVIWALVALLVTKIVAGPDLSDSSGVMWISLGLLSHAAVTIDRRRIAASPFAAAGAVRSVPGRRADF
jgi:hypothetical protein